MGRLGMGMVLLPVCSDGFQLYVYPYVYALRCSLTSVKHVLQGLPCKPRHVGKCSSGCEPLADERPEQPWTRGSAARYLPIAYILQDACTSVAK